MNALTEVAPRSLALTDDELIPVLRSSLYPGAGDDSIRMVLGYCRAAGLDPIQKPVHLVPMRVKKVGGGRDDYEWRDVVMPGIGLYRVQASRTGELAGIDEPEFGPDAAMPGVQGANVPEWCRVTVYRVIGGQPRAFTAVEYWLENYATVSKDSAVPNAMWKRRPRGQIAKCAEAQALRKAFPELGSQPTADETILEAGDLYTGPDGGHQTNATFTVNRKPKATPAPAAGPVVDADGVIDVPARTVTPTPTPAPKATPAPAAGGSDVIGAGEVAYLQKKCTALELQIGDVLGSCGIETPVEKLTREQFNTVKADLMKRA